MKYRIIALITAFAMMFSSCGALAPQAGTSNAAANGSTAGMALAALATQYLANNSSLDLSKAQNVLNTVSLLNSLGVLKDGANQTVTDFTSGLISGSKNLVNQSNSSSIMNALTGLTNMDLGSATNAIQKGKTTVQEVANVKTGIENILGLFKK